jgi:hypothetical protein
LQPGHRLDRVRTGPDTPRLAQKDISAACRLAGAGHRRAPGARPPHRHLLPRRLTPQHAALEARVRRRVPRSRRGLHRDKGAARGADPDPRVPLDLETIHRSCNGGRDGTTQVAFTGASGSGASPPDPHSPRPSGPIRGRARPLRRRACEARARLGTMFRPLPAQRPVQGACAFRGRPRSAPPPARVPRPPDCIARPDGMTRLASRRPEPNAKL